MNICHACESCHQRVEGADPQSFGDAFIAHVRSAHPDWPYSDVAIRNYAEATQRLTGRKERLDTIGDVVVHPVTAERIDDWLSFFDRDAFADNPAWAACYCAEPHLMQRGTRTPAEHTWQQNRELMIERLRTGATFGYLAYADGRPAGWVNASGRHCYSLYRDGEGADPRDEEVVAIACFVIAPAYRRHRIAARLLARVLADAGKRGAKWIEAYPFNGEPKGDAPHFRGPRAMYEANGFTEVQQRERDVVMRRPA